MSMSLVTRYDGPVVSGVSVTSIEPRGVTPSMGGGSWIGARDMLAAVIESVARAGRCYLRLSTREGMTIHSAGERRPIGGLRTIDLPAGDGSVLTLEGNLDPEPLDAVGRLLAQTVATHGELTAARDDLGRSREELSLLLDFSHAVCRVTTVQEMVNRFLADAVTVLKAREGTFLAVDRDRDELYVLCHHGSTPTTVKRFRLKLGQGIAGKVALTGTPRIVNDAPADPDYIEGINPIRNLIAEPMKEGNKVVGVVCVNDRKDGRPFEARHLRLLSSLTRLGQIGLENAQLYEQVRGLLFEAVDGLVALMEAGDPQTVGHSRRVARLAYSLGRQLLLPVPDLERLYLAALIHDLGATPPPPAWPEVEWSLPDFERPTEEGGPRAHAGLLQSAGRLREALPGLTDHREHWDGTGHPARLAGDEISLQGRIVAVAHAFDVVTSGPDFRKDRMPSEALEELRSQSGTRFDPRVVTAFEHVYKVLRLDAWIPPDEEDTTWSSAPGRK